MASSYSSSPLLYSCIAYHNIILAEFTASASSQTSSLPSLILPRISHEISSKLTYTHNENFIHYIADSASDFAFSSSSSSSSTPVSASGLTYMVIAPSNFGRRIPFGYLIALKRQYLTQYDPETTDFAQLPAYGTAEFNGTMKNLMMEYGSSEGGKQDAIANTQREIDSVKGIMTENIERVLERGERIDTLVDKTDRLGVGARDFRVRSRGLRRRMWWKNMKLMVLIGIVSIFLIYLFVGFGCGLPGWSRCVGSSH